MMLFWWFIGSALSLAKAQVCKNVGATCSSCSTLSICVSINATAVTASCNRPTPYCNAGSCSAVPSSKECSQNFNSFRCPPEDGTYPDGSSCNMFHICLNGRDYNFSCPIANSVFSPVSGSCVRLSNIRSCHKVNCRIPATYAVYPGDYRIFFLCVNSVPTLVLRCARGLRFDQTRQSCVVNCEKEGRYVNPLGNGTTFVECTLTGPATFSSVQRTCPVGSLFDEKTLECVLSTSEVTTPTPANSTTTSNTTTNASRILESVRGYLPKN